MRTPALLAVLGFVVFASIDCRSVPTESYYATTQAVPSGLAVSAALAPAPTDPSTRPMILAIGDSIVVTAVLPSSVCGLDFSASAGLADGNLVVTGIATFPDGGARCVGVAYATGPTFRAVVRAVPSGRYTVVVRERVQEQIGGRTYREREIARSVVMLP